MADEMTVHCPDCGSRNVRERNVAYVDLEIIDWHWDEETGGPVPADYGYATPDWEAEDRADQYVCRTCSWSGGLDQLTVKNAAASHPTE